MESSQWENHNDLICPTISFLTGSRSYVLGVFQGMKHTLLHLRYPLFQAQWDSCDEHNHQTYNYLVHLYTYLFHFYIDAFLLQNLIESEYVCTNSGFEIPTQQ